jgi:energy-coupling factor transporter ATP-binding protein EcfA2
MVMICCHLQAVRSARRAGTAIILTTHSMGEAESLCDRLGVFVNGRLQCIGSAAVSERLRGRRCGGQTGACQWESMDCYVVWAWVTFASASGPQQWMFLGSG